jgi:WD40 repeat protein
MEFSPDSKTFATANEDSSVRLRSVATGQELRVFKGHIGAVQKVAFSPDGQLLASGDKKGIIKIWSVATAQELKNLQADEPDITQLAFSPDGKTLFSVSNYEHNPINSWNVGDWQPKATFKVDSQDDENSLFFDQAGQALDFSMKETNFDIYNIATGAKVSSAAMQIPISHPDIPLFISSVEINAATRAFSTFIEGKTQWWSLDDGRELTDLEVGDGTEQPLLYRDGSKALLISQNRKSISIWSLSKQHQVITIFNNSFGDSDEYLDWHPNENIKWSPDGKVVLSRNLQEELKGWSLETGKQLWDIPLKQDSINAVVFSPNSKIVATGISKGTIQLRAVPSGKKLLSFKGNISSINTLAFSPDGQTLASAGADSNIEIWSVSTGQLLKNFTLKEAKSIFSLVYSPDGQTLASLSNDNISGGKSLEWWSLATGKGTNGMAGATSVAFRFDGKAIAVAGDGSCGMGVPLHIYDQSLTLTDDDPSLSPISVSFSTALAFSADGKMLIVGNGSELQVWSATKPTLLRSLGEHDKIITYTAFSADGKTVVSASADDTVKVWDWSQGREFFSTTALQTPQLIATALSPNGKYIATGQQDGSFKLWEIPAKR